MIIDQQLWIKINTDSYIYMCVYIFTHTYIYIYFRRNKVYASRKLDKASISVNRGSHFQVYFVWQVWDGQLLLAFKSIRLKAFGGWKFDRGTSRNGSFEHALISRGYFVIKAAFFCRYHSHLLCQHIQAAYALRMQLFYVYIFFYSTYSYGMGGI